MKHLLTLSLLAFLIFCYTNSFGQASKVRAKEDKSKMKDAGMNDKPGNGRSLRSSDMQGAYSMTRQVVNDGTKDSVTTRPQFKIYTDRYMIYVNQRLNDSLANYGIGTYKMQDGKLIEYVFFRSSDGARKDSFELKINKTGDGYTQIIEFPADSQGRKFVLTEDYKKVGQAATTTPLDGAWKQTKAMYTPNKGSTSTEENPTQFKVYQSGHFIWVNTTQDSATKKPVSVFGYGSFTMEGKNKSKEINSNSSYVTSLVGKPIMLELEFMGKDAYKQTIVTPDGKQVEFYHRLK
ncbi:MAG TPA: hypothetical protein VNA26_07000 [Chitinophagaceae bacterium]|nr:hypothetical protein [Chitinophagaceae bacterium]